MERTTAGLAAVLAVRLAATTVSPANAGEWLPEARLFAAPMAIPNEPRFFSAYRYYDSPSVDAGALAFGVGETLAIYGVTGDPGQPDLQLALSGGVSGVLDVGSRSDALVNADYRVGGQLAWRRGNWSGRGQLYHQSSHLGDDYLLFNEGRYTDFSYEALELLIAFEGSRWRGYGGGEYLFHHNPPDLAPTLLRAGAEYRSERRVLHGGRIIGASDVRAWEETEWEPAIAVLAGLQYDSRESGHFVRFYVEGHDGYSPHGPFFSESADWIGLGIQFGF